MLRDDESKRYNNKDMPELREDDHPSGECSVLADALPGVQGENPTCGNDHKSLSEMRPAFHFLFSRPAVAEILPGMPGGTQVTEKEDTDGY